jgi:FAD:protein FMN transferase
VSALHRPVEEVSAWQSVRLEEPGVAAADKNALGTTARVVAWPPEQLARALGAVDRELIALDAQASRFRQDSEISQLNLSGNEQFFISDGLAEAIAAALASAYWTGGLVDPTVGQALVSWGYDRDFAALAPQGKLSSVPDPAPGYRSVHLDGRLVCRGAGIVLDLGASAKGLGSDRAAQSALRAIGQPGGVLVSLGGDVAVAGQSPAGGWPILVTEDPGAMDSSPTQEVRLTRGALATSSVMCRR